jgi:hypothetical protein
MDIVKLCNLLNDKVTERYILFKENEFKISKIKDNKIVKDIQKISDLIANKIMTNLNFKNLQTIGVRDTTCHYRKIWKDDKYYYKLINFNDFIDKSILNNKYIETFDKAIKCNFYNDITYNVEFFNTNQKNIYVYRIPILNDILNLDKQKYNKLENLLVNKFKKFGIIYTDLNITNIKEKNNIYYLIDLETVTTFEVYKDWNIKNKNFSWNINKSYDFKIRQEL